MAIRVNMHIDTKGIKVSDFKYEFKLTSKASKAARVSEATKITVVRNIHMDTRVIKAADFKSEVN